MKRKLSPLEAAFPLKHIAAKIADRLKDNEYITDNVGSVGVDFVDIRVDAEWQHNEEMGDIAVVSLFFVCNPRNAKTLSLKIEDEDVFDSIDSGASDVFHEVFSEEWPDCESEWSYGMTKVKAISK